MCVATKRFAHVVEVLERYALAENGKPVNKPLAWLAFVVLLEKAVDCRSCLWVSCHKNTCLHHKQFDRRH